MSLLPLVRSRSIVVCAGPGGVGKTTTAAVLALEGARQGRRTVVVTIDPARRLADALGLGSLSNDPRMVEGDWAGELWALMLDTKSTFDALVAKYARSPDQASAILANRFYRNLSGALSGTQEYMAMEKLFELHEEERFELIVVDTPPTRNALDFVDAPRRLTRFLENRVVRLLMTPTRAYFRAVNAATQALLRTIARVVSSEVVQDAATFFQAFEGMEDGFRQRAGQVLGLLSDPGTAFVLVASPRRDAVEEAAFFVDKLAEAGIEIEVIVLNRVHPAFGEGSAESDRQRFEALAGTPLAPYYANRAEFRVVASGEQSRAGELAGRVSGPTVQVPFLADDVHDLSGLAEVGSYLFAG